MTERPLIFNAEMVRAILDGRKTQTRRIMKPQPEDCPRGGHWWPCDKHRTMLHVEEALQNSEVIRAGIVGDACPFGDVGDRLWVRETWSDVNSEGCPAVAYRADSDTRLLAEIETFRDEDGVLNTADPRLDKYWFAAWSGDLFSGTEGSWRPPIHMPRWASRITLEITGVRVERLQDISRVDAMAEGAPPSHPSIDAVSRDYGFPDFSRSWFGQTWQHIYGAESWQANPWVWVVEFKRIGGGVA
ncbi:hypothetical protein ACU9CU_003589 [Cronobacter sakazakii]|nr:hypothetical protein [Cronobacter sakazakii]ELY4067133.1 hypothetical protein [Cronobacter sakazakii]ELY4847100.1 hypothetical protein [Cronobacter sakazakii]